MSTWLHVATLAAYILGSLVMLAFVVRQKEGVFRLGRAVLWLGLGLHSAALLAAWIQTGSLPAATLRQSLDLFSWGLMGAGLLVCLRLEVKILGALTGPLCALLLMAAAVLPAPAAPPPAALKSAWVVVHVLTVLLGYGLLALTFLGSLLYLYQDASIRGKRLGPVFKRLPSLGRLDGFVQQSLVAGFTLFTVGLITGAAYAQISLGSYWRWDPKEVWSLITWLLYAALIHTRLTRGWRGRQGAWLSAMAFAVLLFTFLGAGLLMPGYHSFSALPQIGGGLP